MNNMYARQTVDLTQEKPMKPTLQPEVRRPEPVQQSNLNKVGQISFTALSKAIQILTESHINVIALSSGLSVEEAVMKLESINGTGSKDETPAEKVS